MSISLPKVNKRLSSGLLAGAVVSAAAFFGGIYWTLFVVLPMPFAYRELMGIMNAKGIYPSKMISALFISLFYIFAFMGWERHFQVVITTGVIFAFGWLLLRKNRATISDIGGTIMTFFYLGFLPAHFILLRQLGSSGVETFWLQPGVRYLFLILFIVSASDVFAYYAGKRYGKKPLSPQISPKKTVEGSIAGTTLATLSGLGFGVLFGLPWLHGLIMGLLISVVAQVGDLSESLLKRDAGIKDSGSFLPGHGGVLDRMDSYIFAGAVAYYYILWFVLQQGLVREIMEFFSP